MQRVPHALGSPHGVRVRVRVRRVLATAVATALLGLSGVALAAPAQAEVDAHLLGGVADAVMNGGITAQVLRTDLVHHLPNPLQGII
ncbi:MULTISPECIES: hypothetical protein [Streptomyces]|uniref:hypothetical protein n=1 Tax=Streptomyces TaxID=1883 RepID=UPI00163CEA79|nr:MULTISPECIES: hypothetical protein [Streptomyces]MBC2875724.1 hypothetical protein [Streptomyces sp. TYQ1024]UBI37578.1 hypothetical protein K7I03_14620 [Streptomyces mobaraensis]UKW30166.1 hypothetical protein MCU78_14585 [Streptomyces sp. TYQ1024]